MVRRRSWTTIRGLAVAAACVVVAGCSLPEANTTVQGAGQGLIETSEVKIAVITHAAPGDQFWDFVQSGVNQAAEDYGIVASYYNSPDPAQQATLIDNALADGANGIVVSMASPDALKAAVGKAVEAGVPVVTINSGIERWKEFGAFTHIGQSEQIAGEAVGEELKRQGLKNVICVVQEAGNVGLETRCNAAAKTFGGTFANLQVDGTDNNAVASSIASKLRAEPDIDGVLTLGGQYATLAVGAVGTAESAAKVATFDVDENVLGDVIDGEIIFTVDQQPFAQGYLGVTADYLRLTQGSVMGGGQPVYTGPTLITEDNAELALAALRGAGS